MSHFSAAYTRLALAVISNALSDFVEPIPKTRGFATERQEAYDARIEAGEFLFERDDDLVRLWFHLSGLRRQDVQEAYGLRHAHRRLARSRSIRRRMVNRYDFGRIAQLKRLVE